MVHQARVCAIPQSQVESTAVSARGFTSRSAFPLGSIPAVVLVNSIPPPPPPPLWVVRAGGDHWELRPWHYTSGPVLSCESASVSVNGSQGNPTPLQEKTWYRLTGGIRLDLPFHNGVKRSCPQWREEVVSVNLANLGFLPMQEKTWYRLTGGTPTEETGVLTVLPFIITNVKNKLTDL